MHEELFIFFKAINKLKTQNTIKYLDLLDQDTYINIGWQFCYTQYYTKALSTMDKIKIFF